MVSARSFSSSPGPGTASRSCRLSAEIRRVAAVICRSGRSTRPATIQPSRQRHHGHDAQRDRRPDQQAVRDPRVDLGSAPPAGLQLRDPAWSCASGDAAAWFAAVTDSRDERDDQAAGDGQQHRAGHHEQRAVQGGQPHPHGARAARPPVASSFPASPPLCAPGQVASAPRPSGCPAGPNNGITARVRPVLGPLPYNRPPWKQRSKYRAAQELRRDAGAGRHDVHRRAGAGDRVRRAQRGRQVHHDAGDPRPGRPRRGHRPGRRAAVRAPCGTR